MPKLNNTIEERLEKLEEIIKNHQHLGIDNSKEFSGETFVNTKGIAIHGAGNLVKDFTTVPFNIYDSQEGDNKKRRKAGMAIAITGTKDAFDEQVQGVVVAGKGEDDIADILPTNRTDFSKINYIQLFTIFNPQYPAVGDFPPYGFLVADRTPSIIGHTGTITTGSNTLTDSSADFKINSFQNSLLVLLPGLETRKIVSNTANVMTVNGNWETASGTYEYQVITPIFLGSANKPFTRFYIGEDIRLGYGASGGTQVQYIKWGSGSPEGVVTANPGSLYLNREGGNGTTLYVKQSGVQTNTGWAGK